MGGMFVHAASPASPAVASVDPAQSALLQRSIAARSSSSARSRATVALLLLYSAIAAIANGQQPILSNQQSGVRATFLTPAAITGTPTSAAALAFNPAAIGISPAAAQQLTASFLVSGYAGSFTPTANLHYGRDYELTPVNCTPSGGDEICSTTVTFQPTLPGTRKDAIFLMNGSTRLATVLLNGVGQGPISLVQPGSFTTTIPSSGLSTSYYIYQSVADENGTVYLLPNGNTSFLFSVTSAGVVSQIPLANHLYFWTIGIDGAGVLYLFGESQTLTTYDTVQGIQGTYLLPAPNNDNDWYPGTVDGLGNFYIVDQISNNGEIYEFNANRTSNYQSILNPPVVQPFTAAVDSQGNAFVGGYEIDKVTPTGTTSQVNSVGAWDGLAVDAADTLYATRYNPTGGVAELSAADYTTPIAAIDQSASPLGVSVGSNGTVFVSNYVNLDVYDRSTTETLNFGQVGSTQSATDSSATIYNGGNQPLTISGFALSGTGFAIDSSQSNLCASGIVLAPGALCHAPVIFTPGHPGSFTGTIAITSNSLNGTNVEQTIQLTGTSDGSYDVLSPTSLAFPSQVTGTSQSLPVTMTNEGVFYSSTIYSIKVDNPAFTVSYGTCATPTAPGSSCQLQVTFLPTAAQAYSGTATIVTFVDGTLLPSQTLTLALTGTGTGPIAATPVISPGTGTYTSAQSVAITDTTAASTIYYTTDGSSPTAASTKYTAAIPVTTSQTINAVATATGYTQSAVASATYTFLAPAVTFVPAGPVAFASQTVNTTSGTQTVTLTNSGTAALTISSISITGANPADFSQANNCPASLAVGASCSIQVSFTPASVAGFSAAISVADNAPASPQSVALTGTGTAAPAPVVSLTPATIAFGSVASPGGSATQIATLKNTGNAALTITAIAITGANAADFTQTNNCGASLAPGVSCQIQVTFTPSSVATFSATLAITDNATGSPHTSALSGTGIIQPPVFTISPASVAFGSQVVNSTSSSQTVTLTNSSATDTVTVSNATSSDPAFVDAADTCHASIAPGASCHFLMVFNPKAIQAYSATVALQVTGISCAACSYPAQSFALTGTGTPILTQTPASLNFGNQIVNTISTQQTMTLTNNSKTETLIPQSLVTSDGAFDPVSHCPASLAPGASCIITVAFTPTAVQTYNASITYQFSGVNCGCEYPGQVFPVTGVAIAQPPVLTISPSIVSFGNQILNTRSATQAVTLTNISATDTITLASVFTSDSAYVNVADNCHTAIAPGATCNLQMTFLPTALGPDNATITVVVGPVSCGVCTYPKQTFSVTGTGIPEPPALSLSPASLSFGNVPVHSTSAQQTVTVTNISTTDTLRLTAFNSTVGNFAMGDGCSTQFAPGTSCTLSFAFQPIAPTVYNNLLQITVASVTCPACTFPIQSISMTGTGVTPVITLSPSSIAFSGTQGSVIPAQSVTVANSGNEALNFSGIALTGANSGLFSQTNNCPASLAINASCTVSVSFIAQAVGTYTANLNLLGTGPSTASASATAALSGTLFSQGPVMTISPSSLDFGNQANHIAGTKSVTLTNTSKTDSVYLSGATSSDPTFTIGNSGCSNPVAPGESCTLPVSFDPTAVQAFSGVITTTFKSTTCPACNYPAQTFGVKGAGIGPAITLSPTSLTFSAVYLSTALPQTVNVTNSGNEVLLINNLSIAGGAGAFSQTNNCPNSLAVGTSCTIAITFTANFHGDQTTASLNILGNGPDDSTASAGAALTGHEIAINGQAAFTPASLSFTAVAGNPSAAQTTTLTNTGNVPLTLVDFAFFGSNPTDFTQTNNCPAKLAVGATCQISVALAPASEGIYTAQLNANAIDPDAGPVTAVLSLAGQATPQIAAGFFTPGSLTFSSIALVNSASQTATLTNTGNEPITISQVIIYGTNPNQFTQTNTCTQAIPVGGTCTFSVIFSPTAAGTFSERLLAELRTPDGSPDNALLNLVGTATPNVSTGTLSTTTLTFNTTSGTTSAAQTATLTNTGNLTLQIGSIALTGNFPNDYKESDNCGLSLAVGATCTLSLTFTPPSAASYPATLSITDNDPTSPQMITLNGSGSNQPDFVIASALPAATIKPGGSAVFSLTVIAQNGATIPPITLTATGLPPGATATFSQSTVTPGSTSATSTLTIQTAPAAKAAAGLGVPVFAWPVLALFTVLLLRSKARRTLLNLCLLLVVSLGAVAALSGCSGSVHLIQPPQTYNVTVTGTIGSVQQTTTVKLIVE